MSLGMRPGNRKFFNIFRSGLLGILFMLSWPLAAQRVGITSIYVEPSRVIEAEDVRFPELLSFQDKLFMFYQRIGMDSEGQRVMNVEYRVSSTGSSWSEARVLSRNIPLETSYVPPIYSVAAGSNSLAAAVLASDGEIQFFFLEDTDASTLRYQRSFEISNGIYVEPRVFAVESGFVLFASRLEQSSNADLLSNVDGPVTQVLFARYSNRSGWGSFSPLENPDPQGQGSLLNPTLVQKGRRIYLAYQRQVFAAPPVGTYSELYSTYSDDGGISWSDAQRITQYIDPEDRGVPSIDHRYYRNENPELFIDADGHVLLIFERSRSGANVRLVSSELDDEGATVPVTIRAVTRQSVPISDEGRSASFGGLFLFEGREYLLYFYDLLRKSQVYLADRDENGLWNPQLMSDQGSAYAFPKVALLDGHPYFAWLRRDQWNQSLLSDTQRQVSSLVYVASDRSVRPPQAIPLSYRLGQASRRSDVEYRISLPDDPAGLRRIRYAWSQADSLSSSQLSDGGLSTRLELEASENGRWNLFLQSEDRAGNRSEIVSVPYDLDLIPPARVRFVDLPVGEDGYLSSNSLSLAWEENADEDLQGYQYRLQYLGSYDAPAPDDQVIEDTVLQAFQRNGGVSRSENFINLNNEDNGLWALSVRAVDQVGNVGEPGIALLRMNKYIPVTLLYQVSVQESLEGNMVFRLDGRGYRTGGVIQSLIFDRDGVEPWDYQLELSDGDFRIASDRVIRDATLSNFATGEYQLILEHSSRGLYRYSHTISLETSGAVKIGLYDIFEPAEARVIKRSRLSFSAFDIALMVVIPVLVLVIWLSFWRIRSIVRDNRVIQAEVAALVRGEMGPARLAALEKKVEIMHKQGLGLRAKFTIFMLILVLAVVAVIALPLSNFILSSQQQILAQNLFDKIDLTLQSLSIGAADVLRSDDLVFQKARSLRALSNQVGALDEIEFVTISGAPAGASASIDGVRYDLDQDGRDYLWVTTDPMLFASDGEILEYLQTEAGLPEDYEGDVQSLLDDGGQSPISPFFQRKVEPRSQLVLTAQLSIADGLSPTISQGEESDIARFNAAAQSDGYREVQQQVETADAQRSSATTSQELQDIEDQITILRSRLDAQLAQAVTINSLPKYSVEHYDTSTEHFLFSYPIYWYEDDFSAAYQGTIRLGVSSQGINEQIRTTTRRIILQVLIFAAFAIVAGIVGAFLLASLTVNPIKKLVAGVERIRDADVKASLKDQPIVVKTKDELHFLSETINQMTDGLIAAEKANKSVMMGKDVQKMYITLDPNPHDSKTKATFRQDDQSSSSLEFFGYYEGAKGVSGDYFYYDRIDDQHFAMIKCDVSGKDIEAALIMVTVASLFLRQFEGWSEEFKRKNKSKAYGYRKELSSLADQVNDIIYRRQFKGKFAAFNMLTINERSGEISFCNAGDNLVHLYRRKERKVVTIELPRTPAAGAMHEELVGMPIQFPVETARIEKGDILLLFTDGIDEGRRYLRHSDWSIYKKEEFEAPAGAAPGEKERLEQNKKDLEAQMAPIILGEDEGGLGESFSVPRIIEIIESAMQGQMYQLKKFLNPAGDEQLTFDFTRLEPTLPNVILALMSVEKVYRLVPLPNLTSEDRISIDKKIDDFLKEHFIQYSAYFSHPLPEDEASLYRRYGYMYEDSQYDDLTILAVEKK